MNAPCRVLPLLLLSFGCSSAAEPAVATPTQPAYVPTAAAVTAPTVVASAPPPEPTVKPLPNDGTLLTQNKIQSIVRGRFAEMARCYEDALARDPNTAGGLINVMLAIEGNGSVLTANAQSLPKRPRRGAAVMLRDPQVRSCVEAAFKRIQFPPTNKGIMNMIYPVELSLE